MSPMMDSSQVSEEFREKCRTCNEVVLYQIINTYGYYIWRTNHDMGNGRIPKEDHPALDADLVKKQADIQFAVSQTTRFGVRKPMRKNGSATTEYWLWFRWWNSYVESLSWQEWRELNNVISFGGDTSKWRPFGYWARTGSKHEVDGRIWVWYQATKDKKRPKGYWRALTGSRVWVFPPNKDSADWIVIDWNEDEHNFSGPGAEERAFTMANSFAKLEHLESPS